MEGRFSGRLLKVRDRGHKIHTCCCDADHQAIQIASMTDRCVRGIKRLNIARPEVDGVDMDGE